MSHRLAEKVGKVWPDLAVDNVEQNATKMHLIHLLVIAIGQGLIGSDKEVVLFESSDHQFLESASDSEFRYRLKYTFTFYLPEYLGPRRGHEQEVVDCSDEKSDRIRIESGRHSWPQLATDQETVVQIAQATGQRFSLDQSFGLTYNIH